MAGEFDFMVPEDRAQKVAEFENRRKTWISTRSRGIARFVLFSGILRESVFVIAWGVFYAFRYHLNIALVAQVTTLILLSGRMFNLFEWHWNEIRFVTRARLQPGHNLGEKETGL